jgi:predicted dehydrogenase
MDKKLKVGVIGCGEIAQIAHIPFLLELPQYDAQAICDISEHVVTGVGNRFGIKNRYLDYKEMISDEDLDAVVISTHDHFDPVITAANAGVHVLVEKPIAFNLDQADQMIAAAAENNVKLMVAYMKRYDPAFEYALDYFKNIKGLHMIRVHDFAGGYQINSEIYDLIKPNDLSEDFLKKSGEEMTAAKLAAIGEDRAKYLEAFNMLIYLCSHDAIILHEAFGPPTEIVYSDIYNENMVLAVLKYGDNVRCLWESALIMDIADWDEQLVAFGKEQRVELKFPFPYLKNEATIVNINEMEGDVNIQKRVLVSYDEAFKREWRHFYECITKDQEPITSGEKGRRDLALLIDLIKAA